jgi:hypothetical protein
MSKRLIAHVLPDDGSNYNRAKVYWDSEWREYRTRFYENGVYLGESCDSFTDDKADALATAKAEVQRMEDRRKASVT